MHGLTKNPPSDFTTVNAQAFTALGVTKATFTAAKPKVKGSKATVAVTEHLKLNAFGTMVIPTTLHLTQQQSGKWLINWTPSTIIPQLKNGDQLHLQMHWPTRAKILAANGTPLAIRCPQCSPSSRWQAATTGLATGLVGEMGPITAQELRQLGAPYRSRNVVGQSGIQAGEERELAGTPGADVIVVSNTGTKVATIATFPAHPGKNVRTTIDMTAQNAAEAALANEKQDAALVAINAQTGAVLAAASVNAGYDEAIDGGFPPGSTFKILDSTALFEQGLSPSSAATCPKTITEDGEVFHNAEGDGPVSTMLQAFTESCNTAFIGLVSNDLTASGLQAVAARYGIGKKMHIGTTAFSGSVPKPIDGADLAATSIGQGRVLMSPLAMAMVAADVDTGTIREPTLVTNASGATHTASSAQLSATVVQNLHTMMASVVSSGTAAGTGLPSGTYAKTGTAEFGITKPLKLDAWLVGFRGNIAFAALVVDSPGDGGPTCGPIVARFLNALG